VDEEPVLIVLGGADAVVGAVVVMANILGWLTLDPAQVAAILAFVLTCTGLAGAVIRGQVYSPSTHDAAVNTALYATPPIGGNGPET